MRLAFYAPLKPPDHPTPSGDRRMARLTIDALSGAGHEVELAARFRSLDLHGDRARQTRLAAIGGRLAARLIARYRGRPLSQRPRAWITYHLYYKAPDWLGPRIAHALAMPYLAIEASVADKRQGGPWSLGHAATIAALRRAAAIVSLNPDDDSGVSPHLAAPDRLHGLKPFLDIAPYARAARTREAARLEAARAHGLPADAPWLLAVGMMRPGAKLGSYRALAAALARIVDRPWRLIVAGDGAARDEVAAALAPLGGRVVFAGRLAEERLPSLYAACDLFVWPAIGEAYGMALLEAQAAGLPAVAGRSAGVAGIVADGRSGRLAARGDAAEFAAAVAFYLDDAGARRAASQAALAKTAAEHDLLPAGRALDRILAAALATDA